MVAPRDLEPSVPLRSRDTPGPTDEACTGPNRCSVVYGRGSEEMDFSRENVERLLASGSFFWVDVNQPGNADFVVMREAFGFHPLALEDFHNRQQRHSSLGMLTPVEYEMLQHNPSAAA